MTREEAIATLCAHEGELRRRGVLHAALFGSVARDEAKPTSDIDILIEVAPDAPIGALLPIFQRGHVPIVVDQGRLVGLITRVDLISYLRKQL